MTFASIILFAAFYGMVVAAFIAPIIAVVMLASITYDRTNGDAQ